MDLTGLDGTFIIGVVLILVAFAMLRPHAGFKRGFKLTQGGPNVRPAVCISSHSATDTPGGQ